MNYKLAKKLKDAGFPQIWPKPDFLIMEDALAVQKIYDKYPGEFDPYNPTLEELVEEVCRYIGLGFELRLGDYGQAKWKAASHGSYKKSETGATPSDAVANLWLALHTHG